MSKIFRIIVLSAIVSIIFGGLAAYTVSNRLDLEGPNSDQELIKDFYDIENAVYVSPHGLRKKIGRGDDSFILVDLRSQEEYEKEHITGAISIPAYKDPDTSAYSDVDRIVNAFAGLDQSKEIIVYCYSIPCMTGRKVGQMLADHGIYVKHLGIGWNEWRYFWNLWNHEHEWTVVDVKDYVSSGPEPGEVKTDAENENTVCPLEGGLSC